MFLILEYCFSNTGKGKGKPSVAVSARNMEKWNYNSTREKARHCVEVSGEPQAPALYHKGYFFLLFT
jgi:hypothetical protein